MKRYSIPTILFSAALLSTSFLSAQTVEEQARAVMKKYVPATAVLSVSGKLVSKSKEKELPEKVTQRFTMGVTVGDDGLLVCSNSAIDPAVGIIGERVQLEEDEIVEIVSAKTEFTKVEISYGDTTVLQGRVIFQDSGSDVAFILPDQAEAETKKKTFQKIDLADVPTALPGDQVVGLTRSSSFHGFVPMLNIGRIQGVLPGDRIFFLTSVSNDQGVPVFTLDGKSVGVTVMKIFEGKPTGILTTLSAKSIATMAKLAMDKSSTQ